MNRPKIVVFFGGCSSEYSVSLESASSVINNLNREKYEPVPVGITESGKWYHFSGDVEKIKQDRWLNEEDCVPAALSPDRGERKLLLFRGDRVETVTIDAAFPVMHGRNGEDGTIQGLIEMAGIPLVGCGVLSSALCMDKDRAHKLAEFAGIRVPRALAFGKPYDLHKVLDFADNTGYPLFVKPVKAGSSYGVTKVQDKETSDRLKETAKKLYKILGCSGFARVDMFLKPNGEIVFNEINTIPGFTEHSRYPGMMKAAGHSFGEIIGRVVELALDQREKNF